MSESTVLHVHHGGAHVGTTRSSWETTRCHAVRWHRRRSHGRLLAGCGSSQQLTRFNDLSGLLASKLSNMFQISSQVHVVLLESLLDYSHGVFDCGVLGLQLNQLLTVSILREDKIVDISSGDLTALVLSDLLLQLFILLVEGDYVTVSNTDSLLEVLNLIIKDFIVLVKGHFRVH